MNNDYSIIKLVNVRFLAVIEAMRSISFIKLGEALFLLFESNFKSSTITF